MSEIEIIKQYAGLGAGVLIGGTGMYLMYKIAMYAMGTLKDLVSNNTQAITELREVIAQLCEKLNSEPN